MVEKEFTILAMMEDASLAREFLGQIEKDSYNFIDPGWDQYSDMEIIDRACITYHIISREMTAAEVMFKANAMH